ncbi:hypothetical protein [uncultured Winogradskyella sp.]|uniref:hypothetical protein n=1 Tax=uncultured Winogradskyella sp. TaxID=395353 RepID=UPI00262686B5|nr:hypothetical protein [uncultured Winogradskyella sp.]
MKKILIFIITATLFYNCKTPDSLRSSDDDLRRISFHTTDLISIAVPTIYEGNIKYLDTNKRKTWVDVDDVAHDNTLLHSLSDILSSVTVYKTNREGSLTLIGNSISAKDETYKVIYDFSQTQTIEGDSIKKSIGVAVRMIAEITTSKRGLDLTNLFKLSVDAEKENISGSLTVRSIGISSQKVNQSIPTTTDLSPASIATALQTVATIKSSIYDNETRITPYLIGFSVHGNTKKQEVESIINNTSL